MDRLLKYVRRYPIASIALGAFVVVLLVLVMSNGRQGATTITTALPPEGTAPSAAPPPAAQPATETPTAQPDPGMPVGPEPAPSVPARATPAPGSVAAGRADPFIPLVKPQSATFRGPSGPPPIAVPPPAPLPPPLFPGPEGPGGATPGAPGPGAPAAPAAPAPPPPPPKLAAGAQLVGIVGNGTGVAILQIGGQTFIVAQGELIQQKILVQTIDAAKGIVILVEEGQRFELRMGGVTTRHVA